MTQLVKNLPAMRETWVRSLGWKDLLEKGKATHSSILAWREKGIRNTVCVCVCVWLGACVCPASQDPQIVLISGVFSLTTHSV